MIYNMVYLQPVTGRILKINYVIFYRSSAGAQKVIVCDILPINMINKINRKPAVQQNLSFGLFNWFMSYKLACLKST